KQDMGESKYDMRPTLYHYNPLDGDPATWPNGVPPKHDPGPSDGSGTVPPDSGGQPGTGTEPGTGVGEGAGSGTPEQPEQVGSISGGPEESGGYGEGDILVE
ncbi:MAG: hypothetical protein AAGU02_06830, partial [Lawsonibacter sp.]